MALWDLTDKRDQAFAEMILNKAKKPAKKSTVSTTGGGSLFAKIKNICAMVQNALGHYKDELVLIQDEKSLEEYIDYAINFGEIAIDTETTGLDPFTDHIVGVCIYTPGKKAAYIPMYHISYITNQRLDGQLDNEVVAKQFQRLVDANTKAIFFNAKFDIRMMRQSLGVYMTPYWDGFIAGKCLKENEEEASLKYLWKKYCSENKDAPHFTFDKFFKGLRFDLVPITTAYLYAAMDPKMTYELYKFQEPYLTETDEKCKALDMTRLAKLYREIEMPIITITADIEDRGVHINTNVSKELSEQYHTMMDEQLDKFYKELSKYDVQIKSYMATHPQTKLGNPINIGSPAQLAELFYDILQVPPPDKRNPRGTGEDILKAMKHPLCNLILDYRGTQKLLSTYIDKLPESRNPKTHKIHCGFHQYGADCITGDTIIENKEFPRNTIAEICENNILNMEENIFYPLEITIKNRYMEWEKTSHCIKFNNVDVIKLSFDNGDSICGTYNHPILLENNIFKELEYIEVGEKVKTVDSVTTVVEKEFLSDKTVYDFKVPGTHSFVSNTIVSHNTGRFACIAAGTKITMPGGNKNIEDIKPGEYVYTFDDNNKLKLAKVKSSMFTGTRECIKLNWVSKYNKFSTGSLICTPEHRIKTSHGWVQAKDLTPQDSILFVHRKDSSDHVRLTASFGQGSEEEHVWIRDNFFKADEGMCIHHKDCNRLNNDPNNLQICTRKEHINIHRQMRNGYCGAYDFTKEHIIKICKNVGWDIGKIKYDYETLKGWLKYYKINYIKEYSDCYDTRPTTMRTNGKSFKYKSLPLIEENLRYALELANNNIDEAASYFGLNSHKFVKACHKYQLLGNHTVISIEKITQKLPVYDLEIEDTHNFIANELCVHNSREPNLQNIPSHVKRIRTMFISERKAVIPFNGTSINLLWGDVVDTSVGRKFIMDLKIGDTLTDKLHSYIINNIEFDGDLKYTIHVDKVGVDLLIHRLYCMFGGDFSQQEPKLTADLSGDEKFIAECAAGKDAYGTVASLAFNKPYEECLEFYLDENGNKTDHINKEGKERRTQAKSILLGLIYGRTIETIAEQLGCSKEKAEQIKESVFTGIKGLRNLIEESCDMARRLGYVEDKWGRRRHIPDMQLEPYEVVSVGTKNFDPFFDSEELGVVDDSERLRQSYIKQLKEAKYRQQKDKIKMQAEKDGFKVHEHTRKIEDAKRQCTNSRVQGSAATQCKLAMINVATNKILKDLDFHMILLVHDEIIGEAPLVHIQKIAPVFQQCLLDSAKDLRTGAKCDCAAVLYWYADQFEDEIHVDSLTKENMRKIIQDAPFIFEGDL